MFRIGTSHYRSEKEAREAYCWGFKEAIAAASISVGPPAIKEGEKLHVDSRGRYHIDIKEDR